MNKTVWMKEAEKRGITDFEIYEQKSSSTSIQLFEHKVDGFTISECDGVAIRGIYHGKMGICYLEDANDANMDYALSQLIDNASIVTSEDEVEIYEGEASYPEVKQKENTFKLKSSEEKIALLKQLEEAIYASDDRIDQVMSVDYAESDVTRSILNSKKLSLSDSNSYSMVVAQVMAKDHEDVKSDYDWAIIMDEKDIDVQAFASKLSKKVCDKLNATQIPSGNYPVIMEKDTMINLLGALCGLFDGENASKGISILKDSLNKPIFDEKITIVDDPLMENGYASCSFDDEGVSCKKKVVVDQGVLKTYLHNLKSAKLMHTASTGNGFKAGYASNVGISPTNFYIQKGNTAFEDMVKSMEKGVIITDITGLHAGLNPISTEFSLQSSGFYVEHGEIVKPINLITVAGNFMDAMKHIEAVGNDLKFSYSGIGAPSIKFKELAISGE